MARSAYDLMRLVSSGCHVTIDSSEYSAYDLEIIADARKSGGTVEIIDRGDKSGYDLEIIVGKGGRVVTTGENRSTYELERIAERGCLTLVDDCPECQRLFHR